MTPDRPCTAYFKVSENFTAKQLFDSFLCIGIAASAVRCLQRRPTGEVVATFSKAEQRDLFLQNSPLIQLRRYSTYLDNCDPLIYLTIYDAPYELPDSAIEHRLRPFCKVASRRCGKLNGYSDTFNGLRHYRVSLYPGKSIPRSTSLGTVRTAFASIDTIGHTARNCEKAMLCCICKSPEHKAIDCPLSWYRRPARVESHEDVSFNNHDPRSPPYPDREGSPRPPQDVNNVTEAAGGDDHGPRDGEVKDGEDNGLEETGSIEELEVEVAATPPTPSSTGL